MYIQSHISPSRVINRMSTNVEQPSISEVCKNTIPTSTTPSLSPSLFLSLPISLPLSPHLSSSLSPSLFLSLPTSLPLSPPLSSSLFPLTLVQMVSPHIGSDPATVAKAAAPTAGEAAIGARRCPG